MLGRFQTCSAPLCSAPEIFIQFLLLLFCFILWRFCFGNLLYLHCVLVRVLRGLVSTLTHLATTSPQPGEVILKPGLYFASGWRLFYSFPDLSDAAYSLLQVHLFPVVVNASGSPREPYLRLVHVCSIFLECPLLACAPPFPVELLLLNERKPLYLVRYITSL